MAIYLSRKKAPTVNLQTKTVTAGTDPLSISPDAGYDGMSQVTINPTPTETATVTPTTSQQTVYPTSLDAHLSEVTVNPIPSEYVIPTSITPSNSSPVSMASGSAYKPSAAGYAISSYSDLTPSNTSPASVSSGGIYKASAGGYAISSYSSTSKSPSSTGTYFSSGWNRMTASGYAYSSQPSVAKTGTFTAATSGTTKVTLGIKPKFLVVCAQASSSQFMSTVYNESISTSYQLAGGKNGSSTSYTYDAVPYTGSGNNRISSIDSDGFTMGKVTSYATNCYYLAI